MIRQLELSGDHYTIGLQHGRQVSDLQPYIQAAIQNRLCLLAESGLDLHVHEEELLETWQAQAGSIMEMLRGISQALELDWQEFFRYTAATYLLDRARQPHDGDQGCTNWAASGAATRDGAPMLVKNRDYWPDHQNLQCLAKTIPLQGHTYLSLTSAGSAGVFSSGMNAAGLAVADTHVTSLDIGPGVPRYDLMMEILEHHDSVPSALDYLRRVTFMGNGTLMLVDAAGEAAVVECGHRFAAVIPAAGGFVVSTNHYISSGLHDQWMPRTTDKTIEGNSLGRYAYVQQALQAAQGEVDLAWAKALMRSHNGPLQSICRHAEIDPLSRRTISCAIYLPQQRQLYLADDQPCQKDFTVYDFGSG